MELIFCDLCQEAVPQADLDSGSATFSGRRVVCRQCNGTMGSSLKADDTAHPVPPKNVARRPKGLVSPSVAAALAVAAILLSLVSVVALLVRIEVQDRQAEQQSERLRTHISRLEERVGGTRDGMIARAKQAGEDAIHAELVRFERFERQLAEVREALASRVVSKAEAQGEAPAMPLGQPLAAAQQDEELNELEQQLLFLQARVFELLETSNREGARSAPRQATARLLLPGTDLGPLVIQLTHADPIERVSALYALARAQDVGVVRHVTPLLNDPDAYIRALSARILEHMKARSAVQSLIDVLDDVDVQVREAAVSALRAITGRQFQFDPRGPGAERYAAGKRWKAWWAESWKTFLYRGE